MIRLVSILFVLLCLSIVSFNALAQTSAPAIDPTLIVKEKPKETEKKVLGWSPKLTTAVNMNLSSASNVVGQTDGTSEAYGIAVKSSFNWANVQSEWQNVLSYEGSMARTPVLNSYVKSTDELKYETLYLHSLEAAPSVGPYVKGLAKAPIFAGQDVRSNIVNYNITHTDGTLQTQTGNTLHLTDGLLPLTTRESAGGFWKAFDDGTVRVDTRLGLGAEQVAADNQYAILGTNPDGSIGVSQLRALSQAGVEAAVDAIGKIDEKSAWAVGVETLTPLVSNKQSNDTRDPIRLTDVDGHVKLTSTFSSWASFSYDYKLIIQPQLIDRTQQSHLLLLNINYNLL